MREYEFSFSQDLDDIEDAFDSLAAKAKRIAAAPQAELQGNSRPPDPSDPESVSSDYGPRFDVSLLENLPALHPRKARFQRIPPRETRTAKLTPATPKSPTKGALVMGYELIRRIGSGIASEVWIAIDSETWDTAILKFTRITPTEHYERSKQALLLVMVLSDPHVCNFRFMRECGGYLVSVWQPCDDTTRGRAINPFVYEPLTFQQWMMELHRRPSMTDTDRKTTLQHVCSLLLGILAIHRCGLVVNDLRPENLGFLDGRLMVIDLSSVTRRGEIPQEHCAQYRPPERPRALPASDLFGLGKVLAWAFFRIMPSQLSPLKTDAVQKHCRSPFNQAMWAIIAKACSYDHFARYPDVEQMLRDLRRAMALLK